MDLERFNKKPKVIEKKRELNIPDNNIIIGTVGRLVEKKDIPEWRPYSNNRATIMFDTKVEILNDPFGEERAVWDDIIKLNE